MLCVSAPSRKEGGRRWHIPCPYDHERCALCDEDLARGELINIEYEAGVMHAACSDDPYIPQPGETPVIQVQDGKAGSPMTGDSDMVGPGAQEINAESAITGGRVDEAPGARHPGAGLSGQTG